MEDPRKPRGLAAWYREFAERAGTPAIWEARLRTAENLGREADRLEKMVARGHARSRNGAVEQDRGSTDWRIIGSPNRQQSGSVLICPAWRKRSHSRRHSTGESRLAETMANASPDCRLGEAQAFP
jgi:hypothetical protein